MVSGNLLDILSDVVCIRHVVYRSDLQQSNSNYRSTWGVSRPFNVVPISTPKDMSAVAFFEYWMTCRFRTTLRTAFLGSITSSWCLALLPRFQLERAALSLSPVGVRKKIRNLGQWQ
jgi:hypothetical protein